MFDPVLITLVCVGEETIGGEALLVLRPVYAGQPAPETIRCRQGCEDTIETRQEAALVVLNWVGTMNRHERVGFCLAMRGC